MLMCFSCLSVLMFVHLVIHLFTPFRNVASASTWRSELSPEELKLNSAGQMLSVIQASITSINMLYTIFKKEGVTGPHDYCPTLQPYTKLYYVVHSDCFH